MVAQFYSDFLTTKEVVYMLKLRFILSSFALAPALQNAEKAKLAGLGQVSALNCCFLVPI